MLQRSSRSRRPLGVLFGHGSSCRRPRLVPLAGDLLLQRLPPAVAQYRPAVVLDRRAEERRRPGLALFRSSGGGVALSLLDGLLVLCRGAKFLLVDRVRDLGPEATAFARTLPGERADVLGDDEEAGEVDKRVLALC
jgi:hypothetical protein